MDVRPWRRALVTGASSGIGAAFADLLATEQVDLVLIGRDREALDQVAAHARGRGVDVEVLRADLATREGVEATVAAIERSEPPIDLLVNNAGLGQWGAFVDLPLDLALDCIRVNDEALVHLTHAAAVPMVKAGRGTIIQIASMAAAGPRPQQAVYAASKAFVSSFGQAIHSELASSGVTCTTVLPGFTRTNYFARVGLSPNVPPNQWMTPTQVASLALDGAANGRPLLVPGRRNLAKVAIATPFPTIGFGRIKGRVREARDSVRRAKDAIFN